MDLNGSMDYIDDGWKNYVGDSEVEYLIPTVGAVGRELQNLFNYLDWSLLPWSVNINGTLDNGATQTAAINAYNTTFGNGTNNWAGSGIDLINGQFLAFEGDDATINVPSVVTTNVAGTGLSGNQIGFMTLSALDSTATPFGDFAYGNNGDNFVPSAALVASKLEELSASLWNAMPVALSWIVNNDNGANRIKAINAYNSTFGNGTNQWAGSSYHLINGQFLANSLALKQNKLPAKSTVNAAPKGNQAVVLNTAGNPSNVYTTAGKDLALTAKSDAQKVMNYVDGTTASATFATSQGLTEAQVKSALVSLELLKDVYSALHNEIQNATPTGTPGNVAMYDATTGVLSDGVATYDGSTTYNASTDADKIAVMSGVQRKKECGGYEPAPAGEPAHDGTHPGDEDYCWLWILARNISPKGKYYDKKR